ncbi:APC family permease [Pseudidiomarina gelatinasegens]|jgi:APA family basic amino acid/polyamine antiporter|uniref:APC family permease n=1 Tax=Pseudidiomarina gelatinasegens TaxID=2487740 RepID=UPI0030EC5E4A|tara:strand:- start:2345 stop:3589 length:1245 start_codon:yes stop_codon:yes gene_type:complete
MADHQQLVRSTALGGAILLGLGSIIGTGAFVSVGFGVELAGAWVVWAILIAAAVATFNGLSSAQLAAIHPVSGGTYEYGYEFLTRQLGFTAGWLFVLAKSASAATAALAVGYALQSWFAGPAWLAQVIAGFTLLVFTLLVLGGLRRSNRANAILVLLAIAALAIFIVSSAQLPMPVEQLAQAKPTWRDLFAAAALLFVAYTGYGRIATMGEEVQNPRHVIPRAIIATVLVVTALYAAIGWGVLHYVPLTTTADFVLATLMPRGIWQQLVAAGAVVAMCGVILNLILGVSRVVLAMARRNDLPVAWATLNAERTSAPAAVWVTFAVMLVIVLVGDLRTAWSFSAFTVLVYYSITNLAALRIPTEKRFVPRWVSILGLASCLGLAVFIELKILFSGLILIGLGLLWHAYRAASNRT